MRHQKTLGRIISASGVGLFTGAQVRMTLKPADVDHGIVFVRLDEPDQPSLRASLESVKATPRCTIIGSEETSISTIEHLMAALAAFEISNILVELTGPEVPIFDGSSEVFVSLLNEAGIVDQEGVIEPIRLSAPVYITQGSSHLIALPSDRFSVSYTLQFPEAMKIPTQFYSLDVSSEKFTQEIASARTFSSYEEIAPLLEKGGVLGGSLSSALVYKDGQVLNPEGLRYKDECVRHKILDLIGDLALLERPLHAHIVAIRSGHAANVALARLVKQTITWECV